MLQSMDLAEQLKRCADGQLSIEDFEGWFAENSWNVHQQQSKELTDAVFRVEHLFSSLNDGRVKLPALLREFANLATAIGTLPLETRRRPVPFQLHPPSPYSIAKSQQFIPNEESNWRPAVLFFGSLGANINLSSVDDVKRNFGG
jgi:hypothetical protein